MYTFEQLLEELLKGIYGHIDTLFSIRMPLMKQKITQSFPQAKLDQVNALLDQYINAEKVASLKGYSKSEKIAFKANAYYLKALFEIGRLDEKNPNYDIVNSLLDKAIEYGNIQALLVRAEQFRSGKGQEQDNIQAARCIRRIQELVIAQEFPQAKYFKSAVGLFEYDKRYTDYACTTYRLLTYVSKNGFNDETIGILYHLFMPSRTKENFITHEFKKLLFTKFKYNSMVEFFVDKYPKNFLILMYNDSAFSEEEKFNYLQIILAKHPDLIAQLSKDQSGQEACEVIANILHDKLKESLSKKDFKAADKYLSLIPTQAKEIYASACGDIAHDIYMYYKEASLEIAIMRASPYLKEGIRHGGHGDAACEVLYKEALAKLFNLDNTLNYSLQGLEKKYEEHTQKLAQRPIKFKYLTGTIEAIPGHLENILKKIYREQFSLFNLFKPAKHSEQRAELKAFLESTKKEIKKDKVLLDNLALLEDGKLIELIDKYSKIINEVKAIYPAGENSSIVDAFLSPPQNWLSDLRNKINLPHIIETIQQIPLAFKNLIKDLQSSKFTLKHIQKDNINKLSNILTNIENSLKDDNLSLERLSDMGSDELNRLIRKYHAFVSDADAFFGDFGKKVKAYLGPLKERLINTDIKANTAAKVSTVAKHHFTQRL